MRAAISIIALILFSTLTVRCINILEFTWIAFQIEILKYDAYEFLSVIEMRGRHNGDRIFITNFWSWYFYEPFQQRISNREVLSNGFLRGYFCALIHFYLIFFMLWLTYNKILKRGALRASGQLLHFRFNKFPYGCE